MLTNKQSACLVLLAIFVGERSRVGDHGRCYPECGYLLNVEVIALAGAQPMLKCF